MLRSKNRRVLVVNPNTNSQVTDIIQRAAHKALPAGITADVVNPKCGPYGIESEADKAEAECHVIEFLRHTEVADYRAVVLACFDDLALGQLRRDLPVPVLGTFESGLLSIRARANRIGILTTYAAAVPGVEALMARYGCADHGCVRAANVSVAEAAAGDATALAAMEEAAAGLVREAAVDGILLGSGGLTGLADRLQRTCSVPVVGAVEAAIGIAAAL